MCLVGNESAPIQLAQCSFLGLAISSAKTLIYFSNKIAEEILSNSTRKLLWSEFIKMPITVLKKKLLCHLL